MKVMVTYTFPEDKEDYEASLMANEMSGKISEIENKLRNYRKYDEDFNNNPKAQEVHDAILEILRQD